MAEKEGEENKGQLPPFITEERDWLFNLSWEYETLYYETRWSPNIEVIQQVADHYGVGFVHSYAETANLIFGEATYENGELQDIFLEHGDFDQYEFDEDTDTYLFEGEHYENPDEILDILLERKKALTLNA